MKKSAIMLMVADFSLTLPQIIKTNYMKKLLLLILLAVLSVAAQAQTSVSITNPGFEDGSDGWENDGFIRRNNAYFSLKTDAWYMYKSVTKGKAIGNASLSQSVAGLKAGKYVLTAEACHVQQEKITSDAPADSSAVQTGAYLFANNYSTPISLSDTYKVKFALVESESSVTIGLKAEEATGNFIAVDNFTLTYVGEADVADYKASLANLITTAEAAKKSTALTNAINAAKTTLANEEATLADLQTAWRNLTTELKKVQVSSIIVNPSFESGTTGWTIKNMATQTNSYFSRKQGSTYLESWVDRGTKLSDCEASQVLSGIPDGNYTLRAFGLHIQQTASNSTANKGAAQTGAYIFAGTQKTAVTSMKQYTLDFTVVDGQGSIEVGLKAENPTGNWLCVDYFQLNYNGEVTPADYAGLLKNLVDEAQTYLDKGIQDKAAEPLRAAMEAANAALAGTGTDADGNIVYDQKALHDAKVALEEAMEAAAASRVLYDALQERIDYAERVLGWWGDDERKATNVATLKEALETARQQLADTSLTDTKLKSAATTLNNRIKTVDKRIYTSTSAVGTDAQLNNNNSQWSYKRSYQSKHWVLFWEKGYGEEVPGVVKTILDRADQIFEFYADSLKFITINQGVSKTDTYKMIIRLRYTTEWEASGSGIDNQIGLLTLSNGAHTSRSGQTVAHEIGHCFQYQTHCDNNNGNGWMYNWGKSTLNVFWEMCAQWQAYKFYPEMQVNNEWLNNTLNGFHRHPLCVDLRYNNYFIQDYFCQKHGMDIIGRLWNESRNPEDPFQAYMRMTMTGPNSKKLAQFNDEMWEYGARLTTFDFDHMRTRCAGLIGRRTQTAMTKDSDGFFKPTAAHCIENFGNNAIRLNVPTTAKTVYAELTGLPGESGYKSYNVQYAGWKFGFVALQRDGTRVYGDVATATYDDLTQVVSFDCPDNCSYLWLVVSGAPTSYWTRDWLSWDVEGDVEQWPYKVKLYQTNVYGNANNNSYPTGIDFIMADESEQTRPADNNVYSISGQLMRSGTTSLEGLPSGIYIVNGKKVLK